jgi:YD repeat-containing protein
MNDNGNTSSYTYSHMNQDVVNGAAYSYENIHGAGADEILWRYNATGVHLRYHHDRQGNVTALLGAGGERLERYTYDAFGKPGSLVSKTRAEARRLSVTA